MLRLAATADLARIAALIAAHPMQLLQQPEDWLAEQAANAANRVLVWDRNGFAGFVVLETAYPQVVNMMNLGLSSPGEGQGGALIRAALDVAFTELAAHRVYCDIAHDNWAALKAFARAGLHYEGTLRKCWLRQGQWEDCHAYAILRPEWEALA